MVRVLNFFLVSLVGLSWLALYHVSEKTRVAHVQLSAVNRQIVQEKSDMSVLQAEWQRVADPARIQKLAQSRLGLSDTPTMELSSFELLPRRGETLDNNPVQNASVIQPAPMPENPNLHLVAANGN